MADLKYIDAEEALAALDRQPFVLRGYQGSDWELFAAMPAKPVFGIMLLEAEGRSQNEFTMKETLALMRQMVPEPAFTAWLDGGMTVDEAVCLMRRIIDVYNGVKDDERGAEGKAGGPLAGHTPSSSTGSR